MEKLFTLFLGSPKYVDVCRSKCVLVLKSSKGFMLHGSRVYLTESDKKYLRCSTKKLKLQTDKLLDCKHKLV